MKVGWAADHFAFSQSLFLSLRVGQASPDTRPAPLQSAFSPESQSLLSLQPSPSTGLRGVLFHPVDSSHPVYWPHPPVPLASVTLALPPSTAFLVFQCAHVIKHCAARHSRESSSRPR